MKKLYWLAVQPTPYNYNLYKSLNTSELIKFNICYSKQREKNLPFDYQDIIFENDYFFRRFLGIDFRIIWLSMHSANEFMVVGWNDLTKIIVMVIRRIFRMKYFFWTDSVNVSKTKSNSYLSLKFKQWILKGARFIYTTGNFGVDKMIQSGLSKDDKKIISLPFFVEIPEYFDIRVFDSGTDTLRLLHLSRLIEGKGLYNTIKAIKLLTDEGYRVELKVGGVGKEHKNLEMFIHDQGVEDQVRLLGWLDSIDKADAVKKAHLLIHAVDQHDPFPLVVLESLANGLPVIGTELAGSVSDRVQTGFNGIVVETSADSIADGIKKVYHEFSVKELSKNAREESLNWPANKGLAILENTLGKC